MWFLPLLTAVGGYMFGKHQQKKKDSKNAENTVTAAATTSSENSTARNANIYNYYLNESETGNTLFNSQRKTKRTLFGEEQI